MWALLYFALSIAVTRAEEVGETWTGRRGDANPSTTYVAMVTTNTGRMVAVGRYGQLMISDNGGSAWEFDRIEVNGGRRIQGQISDVKMFGSTIVATSIYMAEGGPMGFAGRTVLYRSADNGNTWTELPFPHTSVDYGGGIEYEGLVLTGLHEGPGGELLAYGTTMLSANMVVVWSIGGAIYRSSNGTSWTLAKFAYGPLNHMAEAGGRAIAVGATTVLDSADGAGWNGYFLSNGNIQDGGQQMAFDEVDRIRLYDVIESGGNFTAYGIIHVRRGPILETPFIERQFTLKSSAPFGPGRLWTVHDQGTDPGNFVYGGGSLLGIGRRNGVMASGNGGESFTQRNASPKPVGRSFTQSGSNITVVNSSEEVWKSTDSGSTWNKIFDEPAVPNISRVGVFFGRLLGFCYDSGSDRGLYESLDNGETWVKISDEDGTQIIQVGSRLMQTGTRDTIRVSDDQGYTWQDRTVASNDGGSFVAETPTGRLVMASTGRSVQNLGTFAISDDNGENWESRVVGLAWGETPTAIFCTADGTLLCTTNTFSRFDPRLYRSEDNGETWTRSTVLQSLPGLDEISNQPGSTVISVSKIRQGASGRIMMLSNEDEIICSDDDGKTWRVLMNQGLEMRGDGPFRDWHINGLVWAGDRWVAVNSRDNDRGQRRSYAMVSGDDGETWREVSIQLNLVGTDFNGLEVGLDGRLIATGWNGAIYTSEVPDFLTPESDGLQVVEGQSIEVTVERPQFPGVVSAFYRTEDGDARGNTDFAPTEGDLEWDANDFAPKTVTIETLNDDLLRNPRQFTLAVDFMSTDLGGSTETPIEILDDDSNGGPALNVIGGPLFNTSEAGGAADIYLSLTTEPIRPVTVKVSGWNEAEGRVSATKFVFTPDNWNQSQILRVTGVDDWVDDGDRVHTITLDLVSRDADYSKLSEEVDVVNRDDDEPAAGSKIRVGQEVNLPLDAFGEVLAVRGAPRGLRWDRDANALVGAPRVPRTFPMRVTILASDGKRVTFRVPFTISPLPDYALGTFSGNVAREMNMNEELGGMTQYRVSRSGACSGFVRMGGKRYPWRGRVTVPAVGVPSIEVTVNRRGMDPLIFQTNLADDSQVSGSYQIENTMDFANVVGWQHTWNRRNRVPEMWSGIFNNHLTLDAPPTGSPWIGDETIPQGTGYARVIVSPTGRALWISQLADGTRVRGAGHLGPQGGIRHWQLLYRKTGSVLLEADINDSDEVDGAGDWVKFPPQPTRERSYADGFGDDPRGPVGLLVTGGRWEKPGRGENLLGVLGIDEVPDNLSIEFVDGGIGDSATDPDALATLDARNRIAVSDPNPARVTAVLNRNTGMLTGLLRPVDDNPENPGRDLVRTTRFIGIWVPRLDRAEGAFQLKQLADPGTTTARTSPILSGKVEVNPQERLP